MLDSVEGDVLERVCTEVHGLATSSLLPTLTQNRCGSTRRQTWLMYLSYSIDAL